MAKQVKLEKQFRYAVAFQLVGEFAKHSKFSLNKRMYQYIQTVYDEREDGRGTNTLVVVYDYKAMKYTVLNLNDEKIANAEITFLN